MLQPSDVETMSCPKCGSRQLNTVSLEEVAQPISDGEWGRKDDDMETCYIIEVTCDDCHHEIYVKSNEVKAAIEKVLR